MNDAEGNAQSLESVELLQARKPGLSENARIDALDEYCLNMDVHVVMVQEIALQGYTERKQGHCTAFSSGTDKNVLPERVQVKREGYTKFDVAATMDPINVQGHQDEPWLPGARAGAEMGDCPDKAYAIA